MTPSEGFDDNSEHLLIPSEQDFVVSKWVLSEKQRALGLRARAPIRLAFAALTLGLTVIGFISITSCAPEYSFNSVFAVFAALSILFSMAWFFWELRLHGTAYDFPTNLVSLANGLKLSWRFQTSRDSQLFLWSGFQSVHFLSKDDLISENAIVSVSSRSLNSTPANFSSPCGYGDSYTELLRGGNLRLRYDLTGFNFEEPY